MKDYYIVFNIYIDNENKTLLNINNIPYLYHISGDDENYNKLNSTSEILNKFMILTKKHNIELIKKCMFNYKKNNSSLSLIDMLNLLYNVKLSITIFNHDEDTDETHISNSTNKKIIFESENIHTFINDNEILNIILVILEKIYKDTFNKRPTIAYMDFITSYNYIFNELKTASLGNFPPNTYKMNILSELNAALPRNWAAQIYEFLIKYIQT